MTLRHMLIFRTVCETDCNATRAAEALHMTQPAVSLAIKELECYYGVRLFDRIGRRLQITDAGRQFLQYAIHISDLFADMETGLRNWGTRGMLRVGASITIGSQFMPSYVKAFSGQFPGIDVRVVIEQADRLEKKLLANELDCALTEGIAHDPSIVSQAYMEDRLRARPALRTASGDRDRRSHWRNSSGSAFCCASPAAARERSLTGRSPRRALASRRYGRL